MGEKYHDEPCSVCGKKIGLIRGGPGRGLWACYKKFTVGKADAEIICLNCDEDVYFADRLTKEKSDE